MKEELAEFNIVDFINACWNSNCNATFKKTSQPYYKLGKRFNDLESEKQNNNKNISNKDDKDDDKDEDKLIYEAIDKRISNSSDKLFYFSFISKDASYSCPGLSRDYIFKCIENKGIKAKWHVLVSIIALTDVYNDDSINKELQNFWVNKKRPAYSNIHIETVIIEKTDKQTSMRIYGNDRQGKKVSLPPYALIQGGSLTDIGTFISSFIKI